MSHAKKLLKSANVLRSYSENNTGTFFDTRCSFCCHCPICLLCRWQLE